MQQVSLVVAKKEAHYFMALKFFLKIIHAKKIGTNRHYLLHNLEFSEHFTGIFVEFKIGTQGKKFNKNQDFLGQKGARL